MRQICAEAEAYLKSRPAAGAGLPGRVRRADHRGRGGRRLPGGPAAGRPADRGRDRLGPDGPGAEQPPAVGDDPGRDPDRAGRPPAGRVLGGDGDGQPEAATAEQELAFAIEWAKSRGLVRPGQHAVLVRGRVPGEDRAGPCWPAR